jgi:hypothetical protein
MSFFVSKEIEDIIEFESMSSSSHFILNFKNNISVPIIVTGCKINDEEIAIKGNVRKNIFENLILHKDKIVLQIKEECFFEVQKKSIQIKKKDDTYKIKFKVDASIINIKKQEFDCVKN